MTAFLRPDAAARRFGVCRSTLEAWARAGLIGRSKVGPMVFFNAAGIETYIASREQRRTVTPYTPPAPQPAYDESWRTSDLWRGTSVDPTAATAARRKKKARRPG